jgi:hypothetical protein
MTTTILIVDFYQHQFNLNLRDTLKLAGLTSAEDIGDFEKVNDEQLSRLKRTLVKFIVVQ